MLGLVDETGELPFTVDDGCGFPPERQKTLRRLPVGLAAQRPRIEAAGAVIRLAPAE